MLKLIPACLLVAVTAFQISALPIVGSSSGTFINPVGGSGMTVTGVGTDFFTWGVAQSNVSSLQFTGNTFDTETETVFSFGTLDYHNGSINVGSEANSVDLSVELTLTTPTNERIFDYSFDLINTTNTSDPNTSADYVTFPDAFPMSTFDYDGVTYTLELFGFGEITGSGFSTIDQFHVLENQSATAQILGRVTADIPDVPEPGSLSLLLCGFLTIGGLLSQRKK